MIFNCPYCEHKLTLTNRQEVTDRTKESYTLKAYAVCANCAATSIIKAKTLLRKNKKKPPKTTKKYQVKLRTSKPKTHFKENILIPIPWKPYHQPL